jgi:ABC-2 type transport system permease protein
MMEKVWIIAKKDIKEAFQSKLTFLYIIVLFVVPLSYFEVVKDSLDMMLKQGQSMAEIRDVAQSLVNIAAYTLPLILTMLICVFFSNSAIVMDKAKRTLESLMATPLSLRQIWLGKSLAVALPSLLISLPVSCIAIVALNLAVVEPKVETFIIPDALPIIIGLIITPLVTFFVVAIVSFLQLTITNPRIASLAFSLIFIGIYIYTQTISKPTVTWYFALIYLSAMLVLVGITALLDRILTKEKVVLSSKG